MQGESIRHRFGGLVRAGTRPQNRVSSATRFVGWRGNSLRPVSVQRLHHGFARLWSDGK